MGADSPPDPAEPFDRIQALFNEYLTRREAGDAPGLEAFERDHPSEADLLRRLRQEWLRAQESLNAGPRTAGSFGARLQQQYGTHANQALSPEAGSKPSSAESGTGDLVRRLSAHAPMSPRYKLEGEVARGGMGAILKVWDEDLRRHLAMKIVLGRSGPSSSAENQLVDDQRLARFLEEAQVTGQLDHPGVVPVHELGLDQDGRVFFTMKLVKGRDLRAIYELVFEGREGWNEARALSILLKACEAVAYAHKKGVIHRDLKPANVMVGDFGEVYVMDWGLARVIGSADRHDIRIAAVDASSQSVRTERRTEREETPDSPIVTMDGDVLGTPAYMPPEQARGEVEKLSPRSDVYAFGAMLYHLLARQMPYVPHGARVSNRTVLGLVINGPPASVLSLRKDVPQELVAICEKAMARNAEQRYADTLALAEDLRAYLERRVVKAYEMGPWAEARKWVARNKPLAVALAAAVVILIVGVVTSLTYATRAGTKTEEAERETARADEKAREAQSQAAAAETARKETAAKNAELQSTNTALDAAKLSAEVNEHVATQKANDVLALSAIQELKELVEHADTLWPALPDKIGEYDRWLEQAKVLIDGRAADPSKGMERHPSLKDHEAKLAEIRRLAKPPIPEKMEHGAYSFDSVQDRWWHAQLSQFVVDLQAFANEKTGLFSEGTSERHGWGIPKRRQEASTIDQRSVNGPEAKQRWNDAAQAIAKSEIYGGLTLTPQLGLLPVGEDPDSHLWEFVHVQTGDVPDRGKDGRLILKESTGIILVLIPAGKFWMGAQKDESGQNYDPQADPRESPVKEIALSAYFLSKYEMTQGQWLRMEGRNPSYCGPGSYGTDWNRGSKPWSALLPVEQVSWADCSKMMQRFSMVLPTEAQWEYACRAGTTSVYWSGEQAETLRESGNVADAYAKAHGGGGWTVIHAAWDDGNTVEAVVGSYRANHFGLHDVHGNVWEWCRDAWGGYGLPVRPQDGERQVTGATLRVLRGGSFNGAPSHARSAIRRNDAPENRNGNLGVRPARDITP